MNNKNGQGLKRPVLDLREIGQAGMAQPKPVVLTKDAWRLLQSHCNEMNDHEFRVTRVYKHCVEFSLTDRDGKPQQYRIQAQLLKRTKRATGKKLLALFLIFEKDGCDVVDTAQFWFEPFKLWLKYWAGKGLHPKQMKQTPVGVSKAIDISKQIGGYKKTLRR